MASKNNPNRKQQQEERKPLSKPTFYGFSPSFWCASYSETIEEARLDIIRQMGITKGTKFEVKPYKSVI